MLESTEDLWLARKWAEDLLGARNSAKYYMADENFIIAYRQSQSFSFLTQGDYIYSQLYGPDAYFDDRSDYVSVCDDEVDLSSQINRGRGFQFWEITTSSNNAEIEILENMDEVDALITQHAPDSSVRPGDQETVFWGGLRDERNSLVAAAVLVRWQSGFHVMASVVTHADHRGKGYATMLSKAMSNHAFSLGIASVGLCVRDTNYAAQCAYQIAGFKKLSDFTNYSRE